MAAGLEDHQAGIGQTRSQVLGNRDRHMQITAAMANQHRGRDLAQQPPLIDQGHVVKGVVKPRPGGHEDAPMVIDELGVLLVKPQFIAQGHPLECARIALQHLLCITPVLAITTPSHPL